MDNFKINSDFITDQSDVAQSYPVGTIIISVNTTVPTGWLLCDGRLISSDTYKDLYSIIGSSYGISGNMFKLPALVVSSNNLYPRTPVSIQNPEPVYPVMFGHGHYINGITTSAFSTHTLSHYHATNGANLNASAPGHSHAMGGSTNSSNGDGGSSSGRAAGPNGPYASGNSGQTNHAHGGAGYNTAYSDAPGMNHAHSVEFHGTRSAYHSHTAATESWFSTTNMGSTTPGQSEYPPSKQVLFLIKH